MNLSSRGIRVSLAASAGVLALSFALTGCTTETATSSATASAQLAETPHLASADNFRDIGGVGGGYATSDGKHVKRGVVYRSNALTLSAADVATVEDLDVSNIYDLRTAGEISAKPDTKITGAAWVNEDVAGESGATTPAFTTPDAAVSMMEEGYRDFVSSDSARSAIAATLEGIAAEKGAAIIHCTAGKDRTGWTTAVLLSIADVPEQTIMNDYLLTNQYTRASMNSTLAGLKASQGDAAAAAYAPLLGVQGSFLDASFAEVKSKYGTMDSYLTDGLGLSEKTIATLKDKLVA